MILVTVGTHPQPFDRLVRAAEGLAVALDEPVVLQKGPSQEPTPHCEVHRFLPPSRLQALVGEARLVITHAGPASILMVRARGKVPLVVPRRAEHGEHVDDHQVRFGEAVADRVHLVRETGDLLTQVRHHDERVAHMAVQEAGEEASRSFAERLEGLVGEVLASPRRTGPVRATFASILRRVGPRS